MTDNTPMREKMASRDTSVPLSGENGYTLVELVVVVIIIGIIAGIAVNSLSHSTQAARTEETRQEMDQLAYAIAGNPELLSGGTRTDYGYVGDIGALPPDLDALYANPGGYSTWNGPYIQDAFSAGGGGTQFRRDAWGALYAYSGGISITSNGGTSVLTRRFAGSTGELLHNRVLLTFSDLDYTPPGDDHKDSVEIRLTYPDGAGATTSRSVNPGRDGSAGFDSIPIGIHTLQIIYLPLMDTMSRLVNVSPGKDYYADIRYHSDLWNAGASSASCASGGTLSLRPNGMGTSTELTSSGCSDNWQCVDDVASDDDVTMVLRNSTGWANDYYALEDPPTSSCAITNVRILARARRDAAQGRLILTMVTGGSSYQGSNQNLSTSWTEYSEDWVVNPATGAVWTWSDIAGLQAGVSLRGQGAGSPSYCTRVWVEVTYGPL